MQHGWDFRNRIEEIDHVTSSAPFDLVVIGGGIHGAALVRLAALNGLRTALFEKEDYAAATSSRSSKMVHGGLRYLEMFDFQQVFEGIKSREDLLETACHIVTAERFLIPVRSGDWLLRCKLAVGLTLYDLFVRDRARSHQWITSKKIALTAFGARASRFMGCYDYCDALMDDARLVIDNIVAARRLGASCLNHFEVIEASQRSETHSNVRIRDGLNGNEYSIAARIVVNCAGPWVNSFARPRLNSAPIQVRFSQGTHLLFSKPWNDKSLFLPMAEKGRYYFVWPHPEGTLVGTTEREIADPVVDPLPHRDEVEEILNRLAVDLPDSGLTIGSLHYAFSGIRTLPVRKGGKTSQLSRKHVWSYGDGVLSLYGGKYTTSYWTAFEGLKKAWKLLGLPGIPRSLRGIPLEGSVNLAEAGLFRSKAASLGIPEAVIAATIRRFGGTVRYFIEDSSHLESIGDCVLRGELEWAFRVEQAVTLEDVMRRRLGLELRRDHGIPILEEIVDIGRSFYPELPWNGAKASYLERLDRLQLLLKFPAAK